MPAKLPLLLAALTLAGAACAATGGPDAFGYTWIDSNEPLGPVFMGVDISGTGLALGGGDDTLSAPFTLGGMFDFYGNPGADVVMSTNGYVTDELVGSAFDASNDCPLPAPPSTGGGARIYALHDDLITAGMFTQYFASCPRPSDRGTGPIGCNIMQWDNAEHFPAGGGTFDMWAILYDNDDIVFEIGPGNPEQGSGSTTGIQDGTASDGLTVACNTAMSVPDSYAVLIEAPCSAGGGGLAPPTTALVATGPTIIDGTLGTINGVPDPAYRGSGIFYFTSIDIQMAATVTFTGTAGVELRSVGPVTIDGQVDLSGTNGNPSNNGQPGGQLVPGVAGGGFGGRGGCRADWQNQYGQRGGGAGGGFGGTTPGSGGGFDDVSGGGGGGNATVGLDSDPPRSGSSPVGQGGCANLDPLTYALRGGNGGAGGGCDVDDPTPGPPGGNDGGGGGASGGGALRVQSTSDITIGATAMLLAPGGDGGTSGGNGGSGGGGAGGTLLFVSSGNITDDGTYNLNGGLGGLIGQANATSGGGPGGAGFLGLYDSDGVIAGTRTIMVPAASPPPMGMRVTPTAVTGTAPVYSSDDLRITNVDLPDASPMMPYVAQINAAGGSGSYTFMVTAGAPPAGLMLDSMTGVLFGVSTVAAQSLPDTFTITVDDGVTLFDRQFCIYTLEQNLGIETASLPAVDPMTAYMQTIVTVGGTPALTFELVDGALPTGLSLDTATGVISGMTGAAQEDAFFGIQVSGTFNEATTMTYNIAVGPAGGGGGSSAFAPMPPATECDPYRAALIPFGGVPPYTYDMISGALPAGLTLDMFGFISGIPAMGSAGMYPLCFYAYDVAGFVGNGEVTINVAAPGPAPSCVVSVASPPAQTCSLPALAIPDNDPVGVTDTITIPGRGIITDLEVDLDITHTWVGDLYMELTHVNSGTTVVLSDRPGFPALGNGCERDDIACTFTDAAAFAADDMCGDLPALGGLALPDSPLAAFIGLDAQSDWTLLLSDNAAGDTGTLNSWCLNLTVVDAPQGGAITVDIIPYVNCNPTFDLDSVEYSIDGGMSWFLCTPAPASPTMPPAPGIPTAPTSFLWSSSADGVATMLLEPNVVVRTTVTGAAGTTMCQTGVFEVDNQCLCGDCDASGALPVTVLDALVAAQFAAGLGTPTSLQMRCCDVDSTGTLTVLDALIMAQAAAGLPVAVMCP